MILPYSEIYRQANLQSFAFLFIAALARMHLGVVIHWYTQATVEGFLHYRPAGIIVAEPGSPKPA